MSDNQWEDNEDDFDKEEGGSDFWDEFPENADMQIAQQLEFEIAHKELNIAILEKAIHVAKDRRIWWLFASGSARFREIKTIYRNMLRIVEDNI
jgi:hypothetical protein